MAPVMDSDLVRQSAATLSAAMQSGEVTSVQVTEACLARIAEVDDEVHAFLHVDREAAVATAADIDTRRAAGEELGPLAGVPLALKTSSR
jgi:Asp-tRNAAsn/Glu-tRNAGln amidotransferase A subunit and related amidases